MDGGKTYSIKLADGTTLQAESDGAGNYIVNSVVEESVLSRWNLSVVDVIDGGAVSRYTNQVLRNYYIVDGNRTFIQLDDMTDFERLEDDYNSKLDYIAMMTEVDL